MPTEDEADESSSVVDSDDESSQGVDEDSQEPEDSLEAGSDDHDDDESSYSFEDQGSSDEESLIEKQFLDTAADSEDELQILDDEENLEAAFESIPRRWTNRTTNKSGTKPTDDAGTPLLNSDGATSKISSQALAEWMHMDDFSSDEDEDGITNRIGRVPLHWYDDYEHIGYDVNGAKVAKSTQAGNDLIDQVLSNQKHQKFLIHDSLHAKNVPLTQRQINLIRRLQAGAFAHPEFQAYPDFIDYFSGVNREISGLNSDRHELKARFQPSKFEQAQVRRWLAKLRQGDVTLEFLQGKIHDMNDVKRKDKDNAEPFLIWKGDEEDELNLRSGPQHIAAPKLAPPTHAESYNPADEYLPSEEEKKEWDAMDVKDRPHGLLIPRKFPNLRSVGAYEHSVRERFERCLDLYLCPRVLKRRLNIDPESLVPSLPKASDLRPFPTSSAIEYETPHHPKDGSPMIRCLHVSPNGQYLVSGASDGFLRLWEVQSGRLLRSWDLSALVNREDSDSASTAPGNENDPQNKVSKKFPVVSLEWNPNNSHHCIIAAVGKCAIIVATGTGSADDAEMTEALLSASMACKKDGSGTNVTNAKAARVVKWRKIVTEYSPPISVYGGHCGPIIAIETTAEVSCCKWQKKGDYFLSVSPKAGSAAVLIHQLSKANSQQPFGKTKGEIQCACFHPNKPYLFVASQQHIRLYHLVKQTLVKRKYPPSGVVRDSLKCVFTLYLSFFRTAFGL